ncbi:MAG: methionine adenosyltransferase [Candidatus Heimdallarchaeota archaeon]|nr:methionine adenosyltransferase [Candidatus Heimdallarchaeota archaeon]
MSKKSYIASESVSEGHPDKVADQISDAILDQMLTQDRNSRVACETFVTTGLVLIGGEIATESYVDLQKTVRDTIYDIGYTHPDIGFYYRDISVLNVIHEQSPDIAQGVVKDSIEEQGAGDQGMMYGYAINHTDEYMPLPIALAHELTRNMSVLRKEGTLEYLRPDGKSQVAVRYEDGKPVGVSKVVLAAQHAEDVSQDQIKQDLQSQLIEPVLGDFFDKDNTEVIVNGTGKFVVGGPHGDAGLTGRKIIVDTYGGVGRHGGGAFSGKDPSKVDRSGAYAARYIAKNVVSEGLAEKCEIQIAYSIGVAEPFSFNVDTSGTSTISDEEIKQKILSNFDLRPGKIIERLDLKNPFYRKTAAYGHFGRKDVTFNWEKLDLFS